MEIRWCNFLQIWFRYKLIIGQRNVEREQTFVDLLCSYGFITAILNMHLDKEEEKRMGRVGRKSWNHTRSIQVAYAAGPASPEGPLGSDCSFLPASDPWQPLIFVPSPECHTMGIIPSFDFFHLIHI